MTRDKIRRAVVVAGVGSLVIFGGCGVNDRWANSDVSQFLSQEVNEMGTAGEGIFNGTGIEQGMSKSTADTVTATWTLTKYHFDAACNGYVRQGVVTTSEGYERTRQDTIYIMRNGAKTPFSTLSEVDSVVHLRHATHAKNGRTANVNVNTVMVPTLGTDTVCVWNGTIAGDYDGERVGVGTIDNVTRAYHAATRWDFPESGEIHADFPRFTYDIVFLGGGSAKADINNKRTGESREVTFTVEKN